MDERTFNAALAGLLHDVGKVEQRARADPWNPAPGIEREGQPVHATWSAYFAQQYLPERYRSIGLQAAYHHVPEKSPAADRGLSEIVALADKLSAGERSDLAKDYGGKRPPQQMVTIFDRVALNGHVPQARNYLPLARLALKEGSLFPTPAQPGDAQGEAYENLRVELEQAARADSPDAETYLENLLAAMQRVTWCVPSAYYHSLPDVSLYDHSRMTAALAACLSDFDANKVREFLEVVTADFRKPPEQRGVDPRLQHNVALLVGGDLSGVQDFIYTLSSKGAAKTLRGRSFYLQLLTEAVLRYVLRELGLPYTNVIYSGGGHFYLLAPLSAASRLEGIRQYVAATLLDHHGTALYLALDYTEVPANGFKLGQFPEYWRRMHAALGRAKQRRYTELGNDLHSRVFEPQAHGGNRKATCAVCGEEGRTVETLGEPDDPEAKMCALCRSFADDLGKALPEARYVALGFHAPKRTEKGSALNALRAFGMEVAFVKDDRESVTFSENVDRAVIWALDDVERWPSVKDAPMARVTRYTVNRIPPMTFDQMQDRAEGIARLGVLRMDVDDLGDIFTRGLVEQGQSIATLARISTLSFQLSLFFEGWVKRLCERYADLVYAVYAGGDDVFLIGPWDKMPDLARAISADLSRYAGGNPDIHISGGLAFIHGKYPVYQAAEDAHDALEQAKHIDKGKNAVCFLGQAVKWSDFDQVTDKFERLLKVVQKVGDGGLGGPQAILQTLRRLAQDEADKAKRFKGRPVWGPWMWLGAYLLKRMADRAKDNEPLQRELVAIRDELSRNNYSEIGQWGLAARWAQLWLREKAR